MQPCVHFLEWTDLAARLVLTPLCLMLLIAAFALGGKRGLQSLHDGLSTQNVIGVGFKRAMVKQLAFLHAPSST